MTRFIARRQVHVTDEVSGVVRTRPQAPHRWLSPRRVLACVAVLAAFVLALDAGYLHAKAWLAQVLLRDAWAATQTRGGAHKPWPWADTHPVARLTVPAHGVDQIVLAGDAGRTLAFGPGWAQSSAFPGAHGTAVISGHRDTHFAFLQNLQAGDRIALQNALGTAHYRVLDTRIADAAQERLQLGEDDALLLVTCWPFDAVVSGGPLRYVVRAVRSDGLTSGAGGPLAAAGPQPMAGRPSLAHR